MQPSALHIEAQDGDAPLGVGMYDAGVPFDCDLCRDALDAVQRSELVDVGTGGVPMGNPAICSLLDRIRAF